jgi:hypothetical protein
MLPGNYAIIYPSVTPAVMQIVQRIFSRLDGNVADGIDLFARENNAVLAYYLYGFIVVTIA